MSEDSDNALRLRIDKKIARYSVGSLETQPQSVHIAPSPDDFQLALVRARDDERAGLRTRIVVPGALSLAASTPELGRISVVELGAYRVGRLIDHAEPWLRSVRNYIDELYRDTPLASEASMVLTDSYVLRVITLPWLQQLPEAIGIATMHADAKLVCTDERWAGWSILATHGKARPELALDHRTLIVRCAVDLLLATAREFVEHIRSHPTRRYCDATLETHAKRTSAGTWLMLLAGQARGNTHVNRWANTPHPISGVFVLPPLLRGELVEPDLRERSGKEILMGLRSLKRHDATPLVHLGHHGVRDLLRTSLETARTVWCVFRNSSERAHTLPNELAVAPHDARTFARFIVMDTLRASRTRRSLSRHQIAPTRIVAAASNLADAASVHQHYATNATTRVDYFHGWNGEPLPGISTTCVDERWVWANTDAYDDPNAPGKRSLAMRPAASRKPKHVGALMNFLILSNYMHRDLAQATASYRRMLLSQLLSSVETIRRSNPRASIRWRPHPAELDSEIREAQTTLNDVDVSRTRGLDADVEWADVLVTSLSTVAVETLECGRPIFVHAQPRHVDTPNLEHFSSQRMFTTPEELANLLDGLYASAGSKDFLAPERRAWEAFFGQRNSTVSGSHAVAAP